MYTTSRTCKEAITMVRIQTEQREQMRQFRVEMTRFMMAYKFALDEMDTKVRILKEEFQLMHE